MEKYELPADLRVALLDYLSTRPIREALGMYMGLQKLQPVEEKPVDRTT